MSQDASVGRNEVSTADGWGPREEASSGILAPSYRKLRPGPGRSAGTVAADQRSRIQRAMIEIVAERGYGEVRVQQLASLAGVSKRAFYSHFSGREECFLATYDSVVRDGLRAVLASARAERDGREQLRRGFLAFADAIAARPQGARLVLVDAFAVGPAALQKMQHAAGLFEASIASSFSHAPGGGELPRPIVRGIVAGAARVARERLLAGQEPELSHDADRLFDWATSLQGGEGRGLRDLYGLPPLPRGPAGPSQETGLRPWELPGSDDRAVILTSAARLAARDGYRTLTVPTIRRAAGVSRRRFDAHFNGVADCFLAALDLYAGRATAEARPAYASAASWPAGVHRAIVSLCDHLARDQVLARLAFVEVFSPGLDGVRWRACLVADIAGFLRRSSPASQRPVEPSTAASVAAAWVVIHDHVASGRARELPQAAPTLSYLILAPAVGADAALAVIRSELPKGEGSRSRPPVGGRPGSPPSRSNKRRGATR